MNKEDIIEYFHKIKYAVPAMILLYAVFLVLGFVFKSCTPELPLTPREKNGVDTVYAGDSAYIIHFKIDSAYEQEQNNDDDGN
jgi:hypothetical protein